MQNIATMTNEQLVALGPDGIRALVANMAKAQERKLSLKVSEKGAVSLYGMGRFPVTLYGTQWERLLAHADDIRAFLAANAPLLSTKP